ncbi:MAG: restriction endonuclease [Defluviicoccus sp.]
MNNRLVWYPECDKTSLCHYGGSTTYGDYEFFHIQVADVYQTKRCPYCGKLVRQKKLSNDFRALNKSDNNTLYQCLTCTWWGLHWYKSTIEDGTPFEDNYALWGKIKEFDVSDMSMPIDALRHYLTLKPDLLYNVNPHAFEKLIASCFSDYFDCEARHVGGPGDGGIDVILLDKDNPTLIQVKRRQSAEHVEEVKTIRELLGVLLLENAYRGMVVTTANRFSKAAKNALSRPQLIDFGYKIELYDYDSVLSVLNCVADKNPRPWEKFIA